MSDRKINFCSKFAFKLFRATVANIDIGSLKSLHTFLKKYFLPYASEIWTKSYGPNYTKRWAFWQNGFFFYNHFWPFLAGITCRCATLACYSSSHFHHFHFIPACPFAWLPFPFHPTFTLPLPDVCTGSNSISLPVHNRLSASNSIPTSSWAWSLLKAGTGWISHGFAARVTDRGNG